MLVNSGCSLPAPNGRQALLEWSARVAAFGPLSQRFFSLGLHEPAVAKGLDVPVIRPLSEPESRSRTSPEGNSWAGQWKVRPTPGLQLVEIVANLGRVGMGAAHFSESGDRISGQGQGVRSQVTWWI